MGSFGEVLFFTFVIFPLCLVALALTAGAAGVLMIFAATSWGPWHLVWGIPLMLFGMAMGMLCIEKILEWF